MRLFRKPSPADTVADATPEDGTTAKRWPWHPLQAVIIVAGAFVLSQLLAGAIFVGLTLLYSLATGADRPMLTGSTVSQFCIIVLAEILVVSGIIWLMRRHRLGGRALGFGQPVFRDFWLPAVAFGIYIAVFLTIVALLRMYVPGIDLDQKQDIGFDDARGFWLLTLVFLALVVAAPVAEEVLFRGFLFGSLRQRMSFVMATLVTSLLFGAAHLMGGEQGAALLWVAAIDTMVLSFALCYLREATGRLWAPILLHAMKNSLAFTFLFIYPS